MTRLLLSLLLACFTACAFDARSSPTAPGEGMVLRTFEVPAGQAQRIRGVLMQVLWIGSEGKDAQKYVGRADVTPDGRLLVLATPELQEGVKALVDSLAKNPPKEPESVTLTYWVVTGVPGSEQTKPLPEEVQPALAEVRKADGAQDFSLVERLSVSSLAAERGTLNGRDTSVEQWVTSSGNELTADVRLERFGQKLNTRVRLAAGKVLVLASSGSPARDPKDPPSTVYFIVKATPSSGDGR